VGALLDGLAAYTERHIARMDRLRRSVALLDYTLAAMRVVSPDDSDAASPDGAAVANGGGGGAVWDGGRCAEQPAGVSPSPCPERA
jgi:hypothetical protein